MNYKHIIWDWNGTLLDDRDICVQSINQVLVNKRLPIITLDNYMSQFTFPVKKFYEKLGINFKIDSFSEISNQFIDFYNIHFKTLKLHKSTNQILNEVKSMDITQSILSAGMQELLDKWIMDHNLTEFFIKIIGVDNKYAHGKINMGIKHIYDLEYEEKEVLMIGDTIHDSDVAEQMNVDCILLDHGHVSRDRLKSTGREICSDFFQILKYL